MLQRLRSRLHGQEGFTLIELLVVILIIGILAAIAIPSFLNQKGKGEDASAKSNARTAQTAMETYYTDHNSYDCTAGGGTCLAALQAIEPTIPGTGLTVTGPAGTVAYTVTATSSPSGRTFSIQKNTDGTTDRTCTVPSGQNNGGCPDGTGGSW